MTRRSAERNELPWALALVCVVVITACPPGTPPDDVLPDGGSALQDGGSGDGGPTPIRPDAGPDAGPAPDGGPGADGGPRPDGGQMVDAGLPPDSGCAALEAAINADINARQTCSQDSDCGVANTGCGTEGVCGVILNLSNATNISTLEVPWQASDCSAGQPCPSCPVFDGAVACVTGVCGRLPPDAGCAGIAVTISADVSAQQTCSRDSDCVAMSTGCGLAGVCGAYLNQNNAADVNNLEGPWQAQNCGAGQGCPPCSLFDDAAACVNGVCAGAPSGGGGACQSPDDCPQASDPQYASQCLTQAPFTGGYCALPCSNGWGCPAAGLICQSFPTGPSDPGVCFESCTADSDCRMSQGYLCCPTWDTQGSATDGAVCYPGPCPPAAM